MILGYLPMWKVLSFIFHSFNVIGFYFQSIDLSKYVVFSKLFALAISSSIKIFLIVNEYPLIYFGIVILFKSIIISLGLIFFYLKKENTILTWKFDLDILKEIINKSYPLLFAFVLTTIYSKIDQIMIEEIIGVTQSGYYSATVRLSEIWFIIGGLV
jgi:O-antigen/teichoic acid export membrane protein